MVQLAYSKFIIQKYFQCVPILCSRGLLDLKGNQASRDLMVILAPEDFLGRTVPRGLREQMDREERVGLRGHQVMGDHQALLETMDLVGNLAILGKRYTIFSVRPQYMIQLSL